MKNKVKAVVSDIGFCTKLIWKTDKRSFTMSIVLRVMSTLGTLLTLFISKYLMNQIIDNITNHYSINYVVLLIIVYSTFNMLYQFVEDYSRKVSGLITTELTTYLNTSIMRKTVNLDYKYFDMPDKYNEFLRNQRSAASLQRIVDDVINVIGAILLLVSMLICCMSFSIFWTIVSVLVLVPKLIISIKVGKMGYELEKKQNTAILKKDYIHSLFFTKNDSEELRYGNSTKPIIEQYSNLTRLLLKQQEGTALKSSILGFFGNLPSVLFIPFLSIHIILKIVMGTLTIGDFSYLTGIYSSFNSSLLRIVNILSSLYQYDARIRDFRSFYGYIDKPHDKRKINIDKIRSIKFEHVYFKYSHSDNYVLNDLNMKFVIGKKYAIVGLNGSGKTTIFKLLCGFYEPSAGRILINERALEEYDKDCLRKQISVLFQDYIIYSLPIKDNISVSDMDIEIDESKIIDCLKMVDFNHPIYDLKKDTSIYIGKEFSSNGIVLSGGQRQKLALARALYRNADMIMLDEPSSALDPESEYNFFEKIYKLYNNKILIMISHKLYSVKHMDCIYCLHEGKVVESGSHEELMGYPGFYSKMYNSQKRSGDC